MRPLKQRMPLALEVRFQERMVAIPKGRSAPLCLFVFDALQRVIAAGILVPVVAERGDLVFWFREAVLLARGFRILKSELPIWK